MLNLTFSEAKEVATKSGIFWYQSAHPTPEFWKEWKFNSANLMAAGYSVGKSNGVFGVYRRLEYDPETLGYKPIPAPKPYELSKSKPYLLPFQPRMVSLLCASLLNNRIGIDCSDAGVGKTYHALAVCKELDFTPAIICTKTGIHAWRKVCKSFNIAPLFVVNWESIIARKQRGKNNVVCNFRYISVRLYEGNRQWYTWNLPEENRVCLIFDECHKGMGQGTAQARAFLAAKGRRMLCLSATLGDSPAAIRNLGYHCGLYNYDTFHLFLQRLGCYKSNWGNNWESACPVQDMKKVHKIFFPRFGGGIQKADIPGFPPIQNIAQAYPIKDVERQNRAYARLLQLLNECEVSRLKHELEKKSCKDEKRLKELIVLAREAQTNKLTLTLRYRQFTEMLKVDLLAQLAREYIEAGQSVAVFVNFTDTLMSLAKKLKCNCLVHGGQTGKGGMNERQKAIEAFQTDKARVILCNIAAGGISISLHDTNGRFDRTALVCPTYSPKQMVQVLGRIHRSGAKSMAINRLIFAAGTIEESVCHAVSGKMDAINSLNEGDLAEKDIFNLIRAGKDE